MTTVKMDRSPAAFVGVIETMRRTRGDVWVSRDLHPEDAARSMLAALEIEPGELCEDVWAAGQARRSHLRSVQR